MSAPGLSWIRKFGTVAAGAQKARLVLESGAAVLLYRGGDYEVFRPSWQRHVVDSAAARASSGWLGIPGECLGKGFGRLGRPTNGMGLAGMSSTV